ncbi:MAG: NosD domain-containing protein, partial [Brevinematia bacterium]
VKIIGGWDVGFNSVVGYSELDGDNSVKHVIFAKDVTNIVLSNLVIREGNANGNYPHDSGGGICFWNVFYSLVGNVIVTGNSASYYGGGIYLGSSSSNVISSDVYSNSATNGGGIYLYTSSNNVISGNVYSNSAIYYGGGIYLGSSSSNMISGSVYNNSSDRDGGGICLVFSSNNVISGSVYNNSAGYYGGGVYVYNSSDTLILNSYITNNWGASINSVIHLRNGGSLTGLVISNCFIGGNNDTSSIGIYEDGTADTMNHKLVGNVFITNRLGYLYYEYGGNYIADDSDWVNINNPTFIDSTSDSTNNKVTNM